jgi:hypothetical protein
MSAMALLTLGLTASQSHGFVESTDTDGELPTNVSGVWLLVTHIQFPRPTATPAPGATPVPPAARSGAAAAGPIRYFNVVDLLRIVHVPKSQAQKARADVKKLEDASVAKANAMVAEELKKAPPVQSESGEVESDVKVLVPIVPLMRQPKDGDDVDVFLLAIAYPKSIQDAIDKANKEEKPWVPTSKDLATLKSSWSTLKPNGRDDFSKIDWKIATSDKYDDNLKIDPTTKDAKFTLSGNQEMIPKPNVPKTNIVIYGFEQVQGDKLSGKHTRAMMASAPFPMSIDMKGVFDMYKLAPLPSGSGEKAKAKK